MSDSGFSFYIDAKTINDSIAMRRNVLAVPTKDDNDTLYIKDENNKKWREHIEVKDTKMAPWAEDPQNVGMVTVQYKITNEHYQLNAGRVMTKNYFIDMKAMKDKNHDKHKRTMMNLGKLNSLIRACGIELEKDDSGRVPYHIYFNDEKPLVGIKFWGVIRDYVWLRDGEPQPDQDIDNFIAEQ